MSQPDLQLGGGYTYQWRCAILLALNYFHQPVSYNKALHALVRAFLGSVDAIHLEGERIGSGIELEDINLLGHRPDGAGERRVLIQVKAKQTGYWTPSDPLLRKALYRLHRNKALDEDADSSRFVFLTNQSFNPDLEAVRSAIESGAVSGSGVVASLTDGVAQWAMNERRPALDRSRFLRMLERTILINFLPLDAVEANVQAKLQAYGRQDWEQAYALLFAHFAELSEQQGGGRVTCETLTEILGEQRGPEPRLHTIPARVADFTGRTADVQALVDDLTSASVPIAGIRGMGGIGKTQLALAVAQRLSSAYPDQLMFELQPGTVPLTPDAVLGRVIHAFEPELKLPNALEDLQVQYRRVLVGRRGLLLFDNAADGKQVRPLLPPPAGWAVIVTSRGRFRLDGGMLYDVELLSPADAQALLSRMLSDGGRDDLASADLGALAARCGLLPLALRLAAAYLTSTRRALPTYLVDLDRARLAYLKDPEDLEGKESVSAVLSLSVDRLGKAAGNLEHRWRNLAVFPAPFDLADTAAVWQLKKDDAQAALDVLCQQSLVDCDAEAYSVHDLLREIALEKPPADEVYYLHAEHFLALGRAADKHYQEGQAVEGLLAFDAILPHLRAANAWMQQQASARAQRWLNDYPALTTDVLDLRSTALERIQILETAAEASRKLKDRRGEGAHLGNLGRAHSALGHTEQAIEYHTQALAISQEIGDRGNEGANLGNLGNEYRHLGRAQEAIEYYKQALDISREIGDRFNEGNHLGNLGNAYADLGLAEQAIEYYEQALHIHRQIRARREEGADLGSLGVAYRSLGQVKQAIADLGQALKISREIGERGREGSHLGNLGLAYADLGQSGQAIEYFEQALKISRETGDRRNEANWLGGLGSEYAVLGRAEQAIKYHEQALAISREINDRRGEAKHSWNLGLQYEKAGDLPRAVKLMQVRVDYEAAIGHTDAATHARIVAEIRHRAAGGPGSSDAAE